MGEFVGRHSKFYKKIKDNKTFKLDTLYFGHLKTNPCVIVF